jgi:hypothetical protein
MLSQQIKKHFEGTFQRPPQAHDEETTAQLCKKALHKQQADVGRVCSNRDQLALHIQFMLRTAMPFSKGRRNRDYWMSNTLSRVIRQAQGEPSEQKPQIRALEYSNTFVKPISNFVDNSEKQGWVIYSISCKKR